MIEFTVRRVPVERTFALRKSVLRPYLADDEPYVLEDDRLPTTVAFAAVTPDDQIISIARITPEPPPFEAGDGHSWRLRSMATSPGARSRGVGASVLAAVIDHVADTGGGILWCNARIPARNLYERAGMESWGDPWIDPDIGPHVVMWRHIDTKPEAADDG